VIPTTTGNSQKNLPYADWFTSLKQGRAYGDGQSRGFKSISRHVRFAPKADDRTGQSSMT
jgi:hypothetical protein